MLHALTIREKLAVRGRTVAAGILSAFALLATAPAAVAAPGSLDKTFGYGGFVTAGIGTQSGGVASAVQPDGGIVSVGAATVGGTNTMVVVRFEANGAIDRSFGQNGYAAIPIGKSSGANAVALQPNGDIVAAGTGRDPIAGVLSLAAVRLLPNGTPDPSFGNDGVVTVPIGTGSVANAVAIEPDGNIVLGGTAIVGHNEFVAAELDPDGSLDTAFGSGGISLLAPNAAAWGMALTPGGDVVLGGQETVGKAQEFMAARLQPDGIADPGFGDGGIVTVPIGSTAVGLALALDQNGNVVLTGNALTRSADIATVRLLPSGALDPSFGSGGVDVIPGLGVNALAIQPNGQLVLGGVGATAARLNTDGSLDTTFGKRGVALVSLGSNDAANGVALQPDGKIVLTGAATIHSRIVLTVIRLNG